MIAALLLSLAAAQVRVDAGLGSAVGFGGVDLVVAPAERVRVEFGAGYGITGWQLSVMPKWAKPIGSDTWFLLGLGPSVSLKRLDPAAYASEFHRTGVAVWLNADAGVERASASGWIFFLSGGLTAAVYGNYLLSESWAILASGKYLSVAGALGLQCRIGVGHAF
ncbi:MAG: hypothetical protein ACXWLM_12965 [Myxococcales bacterium]